MTAYTQNVDDNSGLADVLGFALNSLATGLSISGNPTVPYSPGFLTVSFGNGQPGVSLDLSIDGGPVLLTITLDDAGTASNVRVPVETTVGSHTLHAVNH